MALGDLITELHYVKEIPLLKGMEKLWEQHRELRAHNVGAAGSKGEGFMELM